MQRQHLLGGNRLMNHVKIAAGVDCTQKSGAKSASAPPFDDSPPAGSPAPSPADSSSRDSDSPPQVFSSRIAAISASDSLVSASAAADQSPPAADIRSRLTFHRHAGKRQVAISR
jgi:hypothetical protein